MARQTRVGIWGGPRPMWSTFGGKSQATAVAATLFEVEPVTFRLQVEPAVFRAKTEPVTFRPKTGPMGGG